MQSRYSEDVVSSLPDLFGTKRFEEPVSKGKSGEDRLQAFSFMKKSQEIYSLLPEFDCGACGSPTCTAFSEDVAKGLVDISLCPMLTRKQKNIENSGGDNNDG